MKTLREARQEKQLTLNDISSLTGLTIAHLSWIERGMTIPNIHTRIRLERLFGGGQIDFDVMDNNSSVIPSDYEQCLYEFRYLIKMIKSLPSEEQIRFCGIMLKHFNTLITSFELK